MWLLKLALNFIPGVGPFLTDGFQILTNLLDFVMKHWKVFAVLAMLGTIGYQNFAKDRFVFGLETIPHMQQQITKLQTDLKTATDANAKLTTDIGSLNTVVGQWKSISDGLQKQNDALQGTLNSERVANNKKVQDILNSKTPTTCEGSIDFLRQEVGVLTWPTN